MPKKNKTKLIVIKLVKIKKTFVFIILYLASTPNIIIYGQSIAYNFSIQKDSIFKDNDFKQFIESKTQRLGIPISKQQWKDLEILVGIDSSLKKKLVISPSLSIGFNSMWNFGDTILYGHSANSIFTNITADASIKVLGIPIRFSSNTVLNGNNLIKELSTVKFSIDYQAILLQKQAAIRQLAVQECMSKWKQTDITALINKSKWDILYNLVNNKSFKKDKALVLEQIDSLENGITTLSRKGQSELSNLKKEYEKYTQIENNYNELLNYYRQNNKALQQAEQLKKEILQAEQQLSKLGEDAKNWKKWSENDLKRKVKEKLLGYIKGFEIGTFNLLGSDFTANNLSVNGFRVETQVKQYYNEVAFGKQNMANAYYWSGLQPLQGTREMNRRLFYYRGGIGEKDSNYLHISVQRIMDDNNENLFGTNHRIRQNDIISIVTRQALGNKVALTSEVAYSNNKTNIVGDWTVIGVATPITGNAKDYTAFQANIISTPTEGGAVSWNFGYMFIGDRFISLGNPYLLNNRQLLRGGVKKNWERIKFQGKINFEKQFGSGNQSLNPSLDQTSFSIEGIWKYQRNHQLSVQIAPRYFLMSAIGGEGAVGRYDTYMIQHLMQGKIKTTRWLSFINVTNMNMLLKLEDTSRFTGLNYIFIQQMLMPSESLMIGLNGNMGLGGSLSNLTFRDGTLQLDVRKTYKKGSFAIGSQYFSTINPISLIQDRQVGVLLGVNIKLKWGLIGFQNNLRKSISSSMSDQFIFSGQSFFKINL